MPKLRTCLIAEDEKLVRSYLKCLLQSSGFEVVEAEDGAQALEMVRTLGSTLHLLVSDIHMPNMDGLALVSSLRGEFPKLPVIFISGYSEYESTGEVELVLKPFLPQTLLNAVTKVLMQADVM